MKYLNKIIKVKIFSYTDIMHIVEMWFNKN